MSTILIVEDHAMGRQMLMTLLGYYHHRLLEAADGVTALALARSERPDLIITDIVMPKMDGLDFVRLMRKEEGLEETPVIFYTATYRIPEARRLSEGLGKCIVIPKPSEPAVILENIHTLLGASSPETAPPVADICYLGLLKSNKSRSAGLQLATLMDLGFHLLGQRDSAQLMNIYCSAARSLLNCRYFHLALIEKNGQTSYFGDDKRDNPIDVFPDEALPVEEILEQVVSGRRTLRRDAFLAIPFATADRVYGWSCLADKCDPSPFSDEEEEMAVVLSGQAALAYENILLIEDLRIHAAELRAHQLELQAQNEELLKAQEELEASRSKYADLYNFAPIGYFTLDPNGLIVEVNLAGAKLLGTDKQALLKKPFSVFIAEPDDNEVLRRHRRSTCTSQSRQECDLRLRKKDGTVIYALLESVADENHDGKAGHIRTAVMDITDRKRAEEAVRESKERLALAANVTQLGMFDLNLLTGDAQWTQQHEVIFGFPPTTTTTTTTHPNRDWKERVHPEDLFRVEEQLQRSIAERKPYRAEYRIVWPDGSLHWIEGQGQFYYDAEGRAARMLGTVRDVTARKRAEEALQRAHDELETRVAERTEDLANTIAKLEKEIAERERAEEEIVRLAAAVESAGDAIVITDQGAIRYVNPAFEKMTGYSRDEVRDRDLHILDSGHHDEKFFEELREALNKNGVWTGRLINKKKDGTLYEEECTYAPVKSDSGKILNYMAIKRDVTERARLESIAQAVDSMNNIGYIFAGVRHEIGNPVASISMFLNMILKNLNELNKTTLEKHTKRCLAEIGKVEYLLRTLRNFNMYEQVEPRKILVREFMNKMLPLVKEDFAAKEIAIEETVEPEDSCVYADPRALQQVLLNLMTNSVDALRGRDNPRIKVRAEKNAKGVHIFVEDNGCGIPADALKNLFKPFVTTKSHGTGLGLMIVKKMISKMNGTVEMTSRVGEGTLVEISLPSTNDSRQS